MLPQSLFSSYGQYKTDTDYVASWLLDTAKGCGYVVAERTAALAAPPRLKGKARKAAKQKSKISGKESSESTPVYPVQVKELLPLAEHIAHASTPRPAVPPSFMRKLTRAIGLRKQHQTWHQHLSSAQSRGDEDDGHGHFIRILEKVQEALQSCVVPSEASAGRTVARNSAHNIPLTNVFDTLTVEEPMDEGDSSHGQGEIRTTCTVNTMDDPSIRNHERLFAQFCLMMDLHKIRTYLIEIWRVYAEGKEDLTVVAITTNTAIDFVRNLQKDIESTFSNQDLSQRPVCPLCIFQKLQSATATADSTDVCLLNTHRILSNYIKGFLVESDPLEYVPEVNPLFSELYVQDEGYIQDLAIVMGFIPELQLLSIAYPEGVQAEHEMLRGLRQLMQRKEPILWVTFAFQVYLDIRHVHKEDIAFAYDDLTDGAQSITRSINEALTCRGKAAVGKGTESGDQNLNSVLDLIEYWTVQDVVADARRLRLKDESRASLLPKHYLLQRDPLWCGLLLYTFRMIAYDRAIKVVGRWVSMSILPLAHLYNRLQQSQLLKSRWTDMDSLIEWQGTAHIFAGSLPRSPQDCANHMALTMGLPPTTFARNRRSIPIQCSIANVRKLEAQVPVHYGFKDRYCDRGGRVDFTPGEVEKIVATSPAVPPLVKVNDIRQPLNRLAVALHAEVAESMFDYFKLHMICWDMMRRLESELGLRVSEWSDTTHTEIELPSFVVSLMTEPAVRKPPPDRESKLLKDAGRIMDELLRTKGTAVNLEGMRLVKIFARRKQHRRTGDVPALLMEE
ncbi:unnamed protein product [Zymoseptoria tritici ST99CH_3D1]|nr:unnamed protein product [Zymoseptoria tritici ST99CH_3D1]